MLKFYVNYPKIYFIKFSTMRNLPNKNGIDPLPKLGDILGAVQHILWPNSKDKGSRD